MAKKKPSAKSSSTSKPSARSRPVAGRLPPALAKRATAAASAKRDRLLAEARELIALVKRRKKEVTEAFYDIGEACVRLQDKAMVAVLGRSSFADVCEKDLGLGVATARRLIEIVTSMTRAQALAMGQQKALSMATLAEATPEEDSPAGLYRRKSVAVPGEASITPRTASAREIERAAKAIRQHASAGGARRGRSTTEDERALAALLERRLHQLGLASARVEAVATKPGQVAELRFSGIPVDSVDVLKKAIGR
jgi:hypothetical protein